MKPLVSVLIVEPSEVICLGLRACFEKAGGYNILAPLHSASSLEERLHSACPDLLIVNPTLLPSTPKQCLAAIRQQCPAMPVVALVYQYVEKQILDLFNYQIDIRQSGSEILSTIGAAMSEMKKESAKPEVQDNYELSDRETDVLVLVAKGLSSKEIANQLNISVHTVNSHRKNITSKTGIRSVAGLAVYAMIHNLM
ncbi:MAG: response regulator transcription factor [Bacteroidales bacterium]|nr:response regulator transcription factor [Bacteroidales bacterium]